MSHFSSWKIYPRSFRGMRVFGCGNKNPNLVCIFI